MGKKKSILDKIKSGISDLTMTFISTTIMDEPKPIMDEPKPKIDGIGSKKKQSY